MTQTLTQTRTYTKVDIQKTFESFRSVLRLISLSSGCDAEVVDARTDDVLEYVYAGYLSGIDLVLYDASGVDVRAARFTVSEDAASWSSTMPGDNIWPQTPGGWISLTVRTTPAWQALSENARSAFWASLELDWGPSRSEPNFAPMETIGSKRYSSNAYGLQQTTYKRRGSL